MKVGTNWTRCGARLCGGLFGAVFCVLQLAQTASVADDKGWVLTQRSTTFGDQYVYVSPNGLKISNPKTDFNLVTHSPDWLITMYNGKTHVYYQTTAEKWKQDLSARGIQGELVNQNWRKKNETSVCGMKATIYASDAGSISHKGKNGQKQARPIDSASYWTSDVAIPARLADLLSTAYGLPSSPSIPLRLSYTDSKGEKQLLDTYHAQQAPIPVSYFDCPAGFSPVKSDAEVMMNDEQRQILNDMAKEVNDKSPSSAAAQAPTQPMQKTASTPPASSSVNVGGVNLDKAKVQQFLNALQQGNKPQSQ